ncbi:MULTISPECIES: hypothetical protein [Streptomyces]|uniref:hypothetical protein n=1 Tax=Streptomyces TaxID=1883 RepID=UPI00369D3CB1
MAWRTVRTDRRRSRPGFEQGVRIYGHQPQKENIATATLFPTRNETQSPFRVLARKAFVVYALHEYGNRSIS